MFVLVSVLLAAALPGLATPVSLPVSGVAVVADAACPVAIDRVQVVRTLEGIVVTYWVRNNTRESIRGIALTAAAVDWAGTITHIEMIPVGRAIPSSGSTQQRATFVSADLARADRFVIGVQAVQWNSRRAEWRGALKLNAPVTLTSRE